jgi:hypothetical protein
MSNMSRIALDVDLELETTTSTESGDHDKFAHYVEKDDATMALVEGTPIMALCGKIWVPSRAPEKFPICPTCKEIFSQLPQD